MTEIYVQNDSFKDDQQSLLLFGDWNPIHVEEEFKTNNSRFYCCSRNSWGFVGIV